jgi:cryptochrome
LLLDADWSVNAGTWMWLSCSSFFQQFFHCYCPIKFGRKADPNGDFIRKYLPVLKVSPFKQFGVLLLLHLYCVRSAAFFT